MNFGRFYQLWIQHLQLLLSQLAAAPPLSPDPELINRVLSHHDDYHRVKTHFATTDVLAVFNSPWLTPLERSLHWVGGWRPTMLFHIIYTLSSARLETRLSDVVRSGDVTGFNLTPDLLTATGDLGDISGSQLGRINDLQCETVARENEITRDLARWQEAPWDVAMLLRNEEPEMGGLAEVLRRADELRLGTFKTIVEILSAQQAREFVMAAVELQFGLRVWGMEKDRRRGIAP